MTEEEFRTRLRDIGANIAAFASDPDHDLETAMEQARQCVELMQAEWRHIHRHRRQTQESSAP